MNDEKISNPWVSLFLLVFSVGVAIEAYRLDLGDLFAPGPGFMLFGVSSLLGLLSLHLLLKFLMTQKLRKINPWAQRNWRRVISVFITLTIYIFLLEPIGYLLTTFFLLVFLFRSLGSRRWGSILGGAALISFATYQVFSIWLTLHFPKGIIHFF